MYGMKYVWCLILDISNCQLGFWFGLDSKVMKWLMFDKKMDLICELVNIYEISLVFVLVWLIWFFGFR